MLSRARGLLQARVGHAQQLTGKHRINVATRNYAVAFGLEINPDALHPNQDKEKSEASQGAAPGSTLVRRVLGKDVQARPEEKKQTKQAQSKEPEKDSRMKRHEHGVPKIMSKQEGKRDHQAKPEAETIPEAKSSPMSGRLSFGVVTTSRPTDTSIEELIKDIQPMPKRKIPGDRENPTTLVILLTPGLARYALDSKLSEALYPCFKVPVKHRMTIEIVSAVVDRLPTGLDEPGSSEGMAYMLFRNPPTAQSGDRTVFQQSAQKPGSLTFRMPRYAPHEASPMVDYELQLPLSQTVFTTGLISTLMRREYAWNLHAGTMKLLAEQNLESQTLQLPTLPEQLGTQSLSMPLVPLTPFRRINYVMGNIIRKLSSQHTNMFKAFSNGKFEEHQGAGVSDNDMPASQELEESVSKYFEALDLQPETVSVWAFVVPRAAALPMAKITLRGACVDVPLSGKEGLITTAWHKDTASAAFMAKGINNTIRLMIPQGARLIKVLSGGGGWGKKAGLLSLDPDVQYSTRGLRQDEGWTFDFDGADDVTGAATEAQKNQALGQIVKEGDSIMFLLAPSPQNVRKGRPRGHDLALKRNFENLPKSLSLTFGSIPSSVDMVPQEVASDTEDVIIQHYPGQFGMLSEGGMAVTVKKVQGTTGQSKLDVPFGLLAFDQHSDYYFPQLHSAAQHAELSATHAVASQASVETEIHGMEQAAQTTEPVQIESSPEQTGLMDMFESFADYNETHDSEAPSVNHKKDLDSLLTPQ
jgi:hypothetical protein